MTVSTISAKTYNGSQQLLSGVTVTYGTAENAIVFQNPQIEYYTTDARNVVATSVTNATTYYLKIKQPATGSNYSFSIEDKSYTINPMNLIINVSAQNKVYDGTAFTAESAQYTNSALAAGDQGRTITGLDLTQTTTLEKDVKVYSVKANTAGAHIYAAGTTDDDHIGNYNIIAPNTSWTITKKALKIYAKAETLTSGTAPNTLTLTYNFGTEPTNVYAEIDEAYFENTGTDKLSDAIEAKFSAAVEAVKTSTTLVPQTFEDGILVAYKEGKPVLEGADATLKNYDISFEPADLKITGKSFTIIPSVANVNYGTAIVPSYSAFGVAPGYEAATVDVNKIVYKYKKDGTSEWTTTKPKAVGSYTVEIEEVAEGESLGTGQFADGEVTYEPSVFTISPKALTLTVLAQTVEKKATAADFLTGLATADDSYTLNALTPTAYDEELSLTFSLDVYDATENPTGKVVIEEGQIISKAETVVLDGEGYIENAIKVTLTGASAINYDITGYTLGKLKIVDVHNLVLNSADNADAISVAAANGSDYNVTFETRAMSADCWYTMVLPFKTTPAELVTKLMDGAGVGAKNVYAVVNRMKAADPNKISFKLELNELPANEPFLIKVGKDIDLKDAHAFVTKISYKADPSITLNNNTFKGVLAARTDIQTTSNQKVGWLATATNSGSALENQFYSPEASARELLAQEAYLIYPQGQSQAPLITVEDFDGSTTAIVEISNGQFQSVKADGWYTIDGVRLQGAPTQKGVYINNGKKIVVK